MDYVKNMDWDDYNRVLQQRDAKIERLLEALKAIAAENTNPNGGMAKRCISIARNVLNQ